MKQFLPGDCIGTDALKEKYLDYLLHVQGCSRFEANFTVQDLDQIDTVPYFSRASVGTVPLYGRNYSIWACWTAFEGRHSAKLSDGHRFCFYELQCRESGTGRPADVSRLYLADPALIDWEDFPAWCRPSPDPQPEED